MALPMQHVMKAKCRLILKRDENNSPNSAQKQIKNTIHSLINDQKRQVYIYLCVNKCSAHIGIAYYFHCSDSRNCETP